MAQLKRFGFGVQALIALSSEPNQWSSLELADHIRCEPTALRKIMAQLAEAGLVEARQGRSGGYRLVREPEAITLANVYDAVREESDADWDRILDTAGESLFGDKVRVSFQRLMTDITRQVHQVLGAHTIADLLK